MLILDEPFSGLDPMAVEVVLAVLSEYAQRGVPVLFSSHQLEVVERLSDQLVIIAGGRIRADGTADELRERFGARRHQIVTERDAGWARQVPGTRVLELDGGTAVFEGAAYRTRTDDSAGPSIVTAPAGNAESGNDGARRP